MKQGLAEISQMYCDQATDRYTTEKRHSECTGANDLPFPAFGEWLAYEVRYGHYTSIAEIIAENSAF